jgi:hypothetical protein
MGSGFKDFATNDVLTAAQVDGYLMRQSIMVFASTSARDTALTGNLEEGMHAYNTDDDEVWYYNGSAWKPVYSKLTSFTPTWTNMGIGNGSQSMAYAYTPGGMRIVGTVSFGSTTQVTGVIQFTIPNSETINTTYASDPHHDCGGSFLHDDSASVNYAGRWVVISSSAVKLMYIGSSGVLSNTAATSAPFTWTTSDKFSVDVFVPL